MNYPKRFSKENVSTFNLINRPFTKSEILLKWIRSLEKNHQT